MRSEQVYRLLEELFPQDAFAMIPEVGNSTGANCRRHIDAVVMSLYPSRGLNIYGIEIKVSRSDWIRERDNPKKADEIAQFCDGFYLAISDATVALLPEVPDTWGLISCATGKAKIIRHAPKLNPEPLTRGFVAAMLRRAQAFTRSDDFVAQVRNEESTKQKASWEAFYKKQYEDAKKEATECVAAVQRLSDALEINLRGCFRGCGWDFERNVATVKAAIALSREPERLLAEVDRLERASQNAIKATSNARELLSASLKQGGAA